MERRAFLAGLTASLPLVAGCSGGDGDGDGGGGDGSPIEGSGPSPTGSPTPEATGTPTRSPTGTPSPSPTESPTPTPTSTPTPTPTAVPSARDQYPSYNWGKLEGTEPVGDASIRMEGFQFRPLVAAVTPGTEVTIANEDSSTHSVAAPRLGVDQSVSAGSDISFTAGRTGTFDYVCTFHPPDMLGRLVVTENTPTPATTPTQTQTATETEEDDDYY